MYIVQLNCTASLLFSYTVCCQSFIISCIYNKGCSPKQEWPYESLLKVHVYGFTSTASMMYRCIVYAHLSLFCVLSFLWDLKQTENSLSYIRSWVMVHFKRQKCCSMWLCQNISVYANYQVRIFVILLQHNCPKSSVNKVAFLKWQSYFELCTSVNLSSAALLPMQFSNQSGLSELH